VSDPPFTAEQLAALRGALPPASNTARDLAATAQTRCTRRRALAVVGARVDAAAKRLGPIPLSGQSPFALEVGRRFETALRRDGGARLREALGRVLDVAPEAFDVIDLDANHPWKGRDSAGNRAAAAARIDATDALLRAAPVHAPRLVLHPRMTLVVTDSARDVEPDAIVLLADRPPLLVEIKAYVDHGHRTDTHDLATTRLQLAVYHLALEQAWSRLGLEGGATLDGAVVLRRPNSMFGSAFIEDVSRDVARVRRGLGRAPSTLAAVLVDLPEAPSFDDPEVLRCLPTAYAPGYCLSSCAMSLQCREEATKAARPEYYGSPTAEVLAPVGDLRRAHGLATGELEPGGDEDEAFAARARPLRRLLDAARAARRPW
jgi:hypothetical protein